MPVTSRDIAREIGLSQSTVSRALRGDPRVAPETLARVTEAAERLRYVPDAAARSLSSGRTQTVGVVVADILNPFYPEIVEVLHGELLHEGYATVLLNEPLGPDLARQLGGRTVDGLIVVAATLDATFVEQLPQMGIPLVLLNRYVDGADVDRVLSDNVAGGALAVEHLLDLGHRRIGLIAGPANTSTSRDREQGCALRWPDTASRSTRRSAARAPSPITAATSTAASCCACRSRRARSSARATSLPSARSTPPSGSASRSRTSCR